MTLLEYAIPFVILIIAIFIWLRRDETQWKLMNDRLTLYITNFNSKLSINSKESTDASDSNKALRTALMGQKVTTDALEDHNHRIQQTILLLENKIKVLQDQVVGFKVSLPENISISFAKGVSNANNGNKQRKVKSAKQDNKVRSKKTKPSGDSKRNAGIRSRG